MSEYAGAVRRTLLWSRLDTPGSEYFTLVERSNGWELSGVVVVLLEGAPLRAEYRVAVDSGWRTRVVAVRTWCGEVERELSLTVGADGRWRAGGVIVPVLDDCLDVDLGVTPATNTLPIRRLSLSPGSSSDLVAAWVRFPDLRLEPLPQRYTRLGEYIYRYDSVGADFTAELQVDALGCVTVYGDLWRAEGLPED